ncbi:MAG: FHA domain-containing protein [Planctomycetota bacterium]|jgi:pSer/pThr/pTyr-binding forkhead associated (FHA) protein
MASVIIISDKQKGDFYRLGERTNVIGRDESLPIQILDHTVSRKHLRIRFNKRTWTYCADDMTSKNGVKINELKIDKDTILKNGDIITIGNTELMFTVKDFFDRQSSLEHIKKLGERQHPTKTIDKWDSKD